MQNFSAVAYFFARRIHGEMNIPIGMIDSSWGATCAEVWTPESIFEANEDLKEAAAKVGPNQWVTTTPSSLYNAMIAPITRFKIAGVLWYQGESNTANPDTYEKLFGTMIGSWREQWGYVFPFYYVQIAPFNYGTPEVGVKVRNEQRKTLKVPKTGMVVVSDICTVDDIHPRNKQDVGLRLANLALKEHYTEFQGEVYGPLFKEIKIEGKKLYVIFDHAEGLTTKEKKLSQFEIAGEDGQFYPAHAKIKDNGVLVSTKQVTAPVQVRFAWNNTALATLFNGAGLPASSFISE
jgi:sialate O-acetylesterase